MSLEFLAITILFLAQMSLCAYSEVRWQKERNALLKMAEIERQQLLDRIQARDLPEYKAVQVPPAPKKEAPKDELIPL